MRMHDDFMARTHAYDFRLHPASPFSPRFSIAIATSLVDPPLIHLVHLPTILATFDYLPFSDWTTTLLAVRSHCAMGYCGTAGDRLEDAALEADAGAAEGEDGRARASARRLPRRTWTRRWRTTRRGSRRLLEQQLCSARKGLFRMAGRMGEREGLSWAGKRSAAAPTR